MEQLICLLPKFNAHDHISVNPKLTDNVDIFYNRDQHLCALTFTKLLARSIPLVYRGIRQLGSINSSINLA